MRTMALASLLVAAICSCGVATSNDDASDDDEGTGSTEDHLDMLDIANSWTDKADPKNPDVAGPIWFASSMTLRGPSLSVRAVASGRPREPVGVFSKDGGFAETGS